MNKADFIKELTERTGMSEEKSKVINSIIEDTFIIGKRNKEKMIERFKTELNFSEEEANKIYETAMGILGDEVINKLKHPFGK